MVVEVPANAAMVVEGEIFTHAFFFFFFVIGFLVEFYVEIMCFLFSSVVREIVI